MSALKKNRSDHAVAAENGFSRAGFLKAGGALLVSIALPGTIATGKAVAEAPPGATSWPLVDAGQVGSWLAIHADSTVTAFTGKVELGMGNETSLAQLIAEQLDVPFESVKMVMGDTARCADQGPTFGSMTIRVGGPQLTLAAAGARQALVELAARHLGVPVAQLEVNDGHVTDRGNPSHGVYYGDLVKDRVLAATFPVRRMPPSGGFSPAQLITGGATPKPVSENRVIGQSIPRVDIPRKVTADYEYIHDVKLPGMLHGRVIRPPALGAKLVSVGEPPPGVRVVREKDFLGVVAEREWDAIQAARSLDATWTSWRGLPAMDDLYDHLRDAPSRDQVIEHSGNVDRGLRGAARKLEATYQTAIETHGSIGPSCAVADVRDGTVTAYSGTQAPNLVRQTLSSALKLPLEKVRVIAYPASGCYGRNGADPVTLDAAIMSSLAGVPVRTQWMRWDEHGWDPKGPATLHDLRGGVDGDGNVVAFEHQAWLPSESDTTIIGSVLAGRAVAEPAAGGWAGVLNYDLVPNKRLLAHNQTNLAAAQDNGVGMVSSWLRSPAQFQLTFAMESFIDELAHAAGADPVAFRLRHLSDKRMAAVLRGVAELASWKPGPAARNITGGGSGTATGRGVAMSLRDGTYDAEVADIEVDRATGEITVKHVYVVEDHGLTVNPRASMLGVEAGIVQSVSRTLIEQVDFDRSRVTSVDWAGYPILTFSRSPQVTTQFIDNPEVPSTGVGEAHCCPLPAAVSNALFDATGVRLRALPLRPDTVKRGLVSV
jgi:CO/xanthine dehydrogenase Mo-binding subunit